MIAILLVGVVMLAMGQYERAVLVMLDAHRTRMEMDSEWSYFSERMRQSLHQGGRLLCERIHSDSDVQFQPDDALTFQNAVEMGQGRVESRYADLHHVSIYAIFPERREVWVKGAAFVRENQQVMLGDCAHALIARVARVQHSLSESLTKITLMHAIPGDFHHASRMASYHHDQFYLKPARTGFQWMFDDGKERNPSLRFIQRVVILQQGRVWKIHFYFSHQHRAWHRSVTYHAD